MFNIGDLETNLNIDNQSIGTFIGISDQIKKCWKLAIYLGLKIPFLICYYGHS